MLRSSWLPTLLLTAFLPAQGDAVGGLVEEHCYSCHGEDKVSGGQDLTAPVSVRVDELWRWSRNRERVRAFDEGQRLAPYLMVGGLGADALDVLQPVRGERAEAGRKLVHLVLG